MRTPSLPFVPVTTVVLVYNDHWEEELLSDLVVTVLSYSGLPLL